MFINLLFKHFRTCWKRKDKITSYDIIRSEIAKFFRTNYFSMCLLFNIFVDSFMTFFVLFYLFCIHKIMLHFKRKQYYFSERNESRVLSNIDWQKINIWIYILFVMLYKNNNLEMGFWTFDTRDINLSKTRNTQKYYSWY